MATDVVRQGTSAQSPARAAVSVEVIAYVILAVLALVLRVAELDQAPLSNVEAREALAAWHFVWPDAPGEAPAAASPLLFALNSVALTAFGASDLSARLMTALGGAALVLLPALWRREMGRVAALVASALLLVSPTAHMAARTMSPVVWSVALAVVGLWLAWRFVQTQKPAYAVCATTLGIVLLLLAEPAGFVLLAILAVAWGAAVLLSGDDAPEAHPAPRLRAAWAAWPWQQALVISSATVVLVATFFFLYPGGLSHVGEVLSDGLAGIGNRPAGYPLSFPLLVTMLYEPVLWVLGGVGVYYALNGERFWGRFLFGWLVGGLLASLLYAGAGPAHALWLVVPLAALAGEVGARVLRPVEDAYWEVPPWAVPALALGAAALLSITAVNLLQVARVLMTAADAASAQLDLRPLVVLPGSLLMLALLYFLGGSLWGARAAWKSVGLSLLLVLGACSLASAWRVSVERFDDPRELWHVNPVGRELHLLRETVIEASIRATGERDRLSLVVEGPDDGAVAWQVRDFADARFVPRLARGTDVSLVITPYRPEPPALGARYVGQDFIVTRTWNLASLRWEDVPIWILQREAQAPAQIGEQAVIWLREDVYGLPPAEETDSSGEESTP